VHRVRPSSRALYYGESHPTIISEWVCANLILIQGEILFEGRYAKAPTWAVNAHRKQSSEEDFGFRIELWWHQLDRRHRFRERHAVDRGPMQRNHLTKVTVMQSVYGM
jgi:hypothetical protein